MAIELGRRKAWQEAIKALQVPSDIEAYLHFSERYGMIANGFYFAGRMLHEREQVKTKIRSVLRYPILLLWVIMLLFFVMTFFVFPQFESLFSTMNIDYPLITTFTFALFQSIPYILLMFVFIFLLGFVAYQLWFKSKTAIEKLHYFSRVPFVSTLLRIYVTYSISLQFGHLLRGGLVAHDVLRVFISHEKRSLFSEEGKRLEQLLDSGTSLDEAFLDGGIYTKEFPAIVRHGQDAGQLADDLVHYSEMLFEEMNERTKQLVFSIQPIMFLVIGMAMLLLFMSIFIPIFQLITSIDG